jgi:transposase
MPPKDRFKDSARVRQYDTYMMQYLSFRQAGMKAEAAFKKLCATGYSRSRVHFYRQLGLFEDTGTTTARVKSAGRKPFFTTANLRKIRKYVDKKNMTPDSVDRFDLHEYISNEFKLDVSMSTVHQVVKKLKLVKKDKKKATRAKNVKTQDELREDYWNFVTKMWQKDVYKKPENVFSIDTTYTRIPKKRESTLASRGSPIAVAKKGVLVYTDAIVTMIDAKGTNRTKCKLYTFNPKMAPVQAYARHGQVFRRNRKAFEEALAKYGMDESRIVYEKSTKHFRGESPEIYENFLNSYAIPKDALIFHDSGPNLKRSKMWIFDQMGFRNHQVYPSDVHQWLSPNDNNLHGCKSIWEKELKNMESDLDPPLRLMQLIDYTTEKFSKEFFYRNLIRVKKGNLDEIMKG